MEGGSRAAGSGFKGSKTSRKLGQSCSEVGGCVLGAHPTLHKMSHLELTQVSCWGPRLQAQRDDGPDHPSSEPLVVGLALAHSCLNPMLFLYFGQAQLRQSLPAACRWALKEPQSEDESMVSKKSTSHDLVSEMEV